MSRRTVLQGHRRHRGAAAARSDGPGPDGVFGRRGGQEDPASSPSRWCTARPGSTAFGLKKNLWAPAGGRPRLRSDADEPQPARAVPRLPDHRQQHRRAQRRGVHGARNRRRSLPLERGVPDPGAPEADAGLRRPRRHVARPDLRAEVRAGHADSVDAAVHRERRPGRRLLLRLLVRLHRLDQLGVAGRAAADGARPARRSSTSCSASARRRPSAAERRAEDRSILDWLGTVDRRG